MNFCPFGCWARSPWPSKARCPPPFVKIPIKTPTAEIIKNAPKIG